MSQSLKSVGAITMFVEDQQKSKTFYENVFGVPVLFEDATSAAFKFENMIVNFITIPAAHELIDPGIVAARESGARFQLTIWVDDVDAACAGLAAHGVELINGPMDRRWGMRTVCFSDPDGHLWEFAAGIIKQDK